MNEHPYPLPMFPLGTVLFPYAITTLHVFEERYRVLARECTQGNGEFGIVLIERGHEVGGGDVRFGVGTLARVVESVELPDGRWLLAVAGVRRLGIVKWLPDAPYPKALVQERADAGALSAADIDQVEWVERAVRRALAYKAELGEPAAPAMVELASDTHVRAMQLASLAPLGPLDHQALLEVDDPVARVQRLAAMVDEENAVLAARLSGG